MGNFCATCYALSLLSRMDLPNLISRTSPNLILGVLGGSFHFFQILIENAISKQWDPDQTMHYDLGLHCLPMSHKKDKMG